MRGSTQEGYRIFLTGEVPIVYYPRRNPVALFRQYFNFGRGRARNFLKHRSSAKPRHLVLAVVAPATLLLVLSPFAPLLALPALAWGLLCVGYGVVLGARLRDPCAAASGFAAMATQAGWSFGFWAELIGEAGKPRHARLAARRQTFGLVARSRSDRTMTSPRRRRRGRPSSASSWPTTMARPISRDAIASVRRQSLQRARAHRFR